MKATLIVFVLISAMSVQIIYGNYNQYQHQITHYNRQLTQTSDVGFKEIDYIDRIDVLQFCSVTLMKTCAENDILKRRQGSPRLPIDVKLFYDEEDEEDGEKKLGASLYLLIDKLSSVNFKIRNLTIIIALVYMDKVSNVLHLYANSRTVRRLFGGCLIIASKMHMNEISREDLAECLDISMIELVNIESAIVLSVKDLTISPQVLTSYLTPIIGSRSTASNIYSSQSEGNSQYNYYQ